MPKSLGEEHGARTRAEKAGGLDSYLESIGAGDDLKKTGFGRRESPWENSTRVSPDTIDRKNRP